MIPALIPTERLGPLLLDWIDEDEGRTRRVLSELSGVPERRIYAVLSGEQRFVQFDTADRLLCGMDVVEEWHLSLADLYSATDADGAKATARRAAKRGSRRRANVLDELVATREAAVAAGRLPAQPR